MFQLVEKHFKPPDHFSSYSKFFSSLCFTLEQAGNGQSEPF